MKQLTKAEEEIMHYLWKLEKAFVKEILAEIEEPKPAYNTVSTIVRLLEKKGFVGYESFGKSHRYYPLVSKEEYSKSTVKGILDGYFEGSFKQLVSFFIKDEKLSVKELDEIQAFIEKKKKDQSWWNI